MKTITVRTGDHQGEAFARSMQRRSMVALWYEGADGFLHRRDGRYYHRRNPRHIERCRNLIAQRIHRVSPQRHPALMANEWLP